MGFPALVLVQGNVGAVFNWDFQELILAAIGFLFLFLVDIWFLVGCVLVEGLSGYVFLENGFDGAAVGGCSFVNWR
jgi:hypothetical protein